MSLTKRILLRNGANIGLLFSCRTTSSLNLLLLLVFKTQSTKINPITCEEVFDENDALEGLQRLKNLSLTYERNAFVYDKHITTSTNHTQHGIVDASNPDTPTQDKSHTY
jgi:hypothetical protein